METRLSLITKRMIEEKKSRLSVIQAESIRLQYESTFNHLMDEVDQRDSAWVYADDLTALENRSSARISKSIRLASFYAVLTVVFIFAMVGVACGAL